MPMDAPPTSPKEWEDQTRRNHFTPLSSRIDSKSGSDWSHDKLLTFRVLHKKKTKEYPDFLKTYIPDAEKTLHKLPRFQETANLLVNSEWQKMDPNSLFRKANEFGNSFCLLADLIELQPQPATLRQSDRNKDTNKNKEPPKAPVADGSSFESDSSGVSSNRMTASSRIENGGLGDSTSNRRAEIAFNGESVR